MFKSLTKISDKLYHKYHGLKYMHTDWQSHHYVETTIESTGTEGLELEPFKT